MTYIYKYPVVGEGIPNRIQCKKEKLLDIQLQDDQMMLWVETDDELPVTTTELIGLGTGWPISTEAIQYMRYFKTVQDAFGLVWHFYELMEGSLA